MSTNGLTNNYNAVFYVLMYLENSVGRHCYCIYPHKNFNHKGGRGWFLFSPDKFLQLVCIPKLNLWVVWRCHSATVTVTNIITHNRQLSGATWGQYKYITTTVPSISDFLVQTFYYRYQPTVFVLGWGQWGLEVNWKFSSWSTKAGELRLSH